MITARYIRMSAATLFIAVAVILVISVRPAFAALNNCTGGSDLSHNLVSATCTETAQTNWFLQVICERPSGNNTVINGTLQSGPGTATSIAVCPRGTTIGDTTLVEL